MLTFWQRLRSAPPCVDDAISVTLPHPQALLPQDHRTAREPFFYEQDVSLPCFLPSADAVFSSPWCIWCGFEALTTAALEEHQLEAHFATDFPAANLRLHRLASLAAAWPSAPARPVLRDCMRRVSRRRMLYFVLSPPQYPSTTGLRS